MAFRIEVIEMNDAAKSISKVVATKGLNLIRMWNQYVEQNIPLRYQFFKVGPGGIGGDVNRKPRLRTGRQIRRKFTAKQANIDDDQEATHPKQSFHLFRKVNLCEVANENSVKVASGSFFLGTFPFIQCIGFQHTFGSRESFQGFHNHPDFQGNGGKSDTP